jgi:hypothetical protein
MSARNQILITVHFPADLLSQIDVRAVELKLRRDEYLRELALKNISAEASYRVVRGRFSPTDSTPQHV